MTIRAHLLRLVGARRKSPSSHVKAACTKGSRIVLRSRNVNVPQGGVMKVQKIMVRALALAASLCGLGLVTQAQTQQTFSFPNFNTPTNIALVGSAGTAQGVNGNVLRITPATGDQVGSAWYSNPQPLAAGFTTTFTFQFTGRNGTGGGADGIAFVVQGPGVGAIGIDGGAIGYG